MSDAKSFKMRGLSLRDNRALDGDSITFERAENVIAQDAGELIARYPVFATTNESIPTSSYAAELAPFSGSEVCLMENGVGFVLGPNAPLDLFYYASYGAYAGRVRGMQMAELARQLFLATNRGIVRLQDPSNSQLIAAGMRKPYLPDQPTAAAGSWLKAGESVAYRIVIGTYTTNAGAGGEPANLQLSAPSDRVEFTATADCAVNLSFTVPTWATVGHFFQVYRSPSAPSGATPIDELGQVYEAQFTSAQLSARAVSLVDIALPETLSTALYTNERQEGALAANFPTPAAAGIVAHKGFLFAIAPEDRPKTSFSLLANLSDGQTFTFGSVTYTAKTTPTLSTHFQIYTAGSPTQNITRTSQNLVRCINAKAATLSEGSDDGAMEAYWSSNPDLPGGIITVQMKEFYQGITPAASTTATVLASPLDPFRRNTVTHDEVAFSKSGEPGSWPILNRLTLGSASGSTTTGAVSLGDSLLLLRTDGAWRILGDDAETFRAERLPASPPNFIARTAQKLNGRVYALTESGVVAGGENGFVDVGEDIRPALFGATRFTDAWAVANETLGLYHLFISFDDPTGGDRTRLHYTCYTLSTRTGEWTQEMLDMRCGCAAASVGSRALKYITQNGIAVIADTLDGPGVAAFGGTTRYPDAGGGMDRPKLRLRTAASAGDTTLNVTDARSVSVGDGYSLGLTGAGYFVSTPDGTITNVNPSIHGAHTVTLSNPLPNPISSGGTISLMSPIRLVLQPRPIDMGSSVDPKHFQEVGLIIDRAVLPSQVSVAFSRDGLASEAFGAALVRATSAIARELCDWLVPRDYRRAPLIRVLFSLTGNPTVRGLRVRFTQEGARVR